MPPSLIPVTRHTSWTLALLLIVLLRGSLFAESETDFWPEMQYYHRLNEKFRLRFAVGVTRSEPFKGKSEGFSEADLDIGLKKILRRREHPDDHLGKYLSLRLGYKYLRKFSENTSIEHRGIVEITGRAPLPNHFLASNRNRVEFRSVEGERSNRYRNRTKVERPGKICGLKVNPYGYVEFYYDTRVDGWNRTEYSIGSEFPFRKHFVLEFYYAFQNNRGPGPVD